MKSKFSHLAVVQRYLFVYFFVCFLAAFLVVCVTGDKACLLGYCNINVIIMIIIHLS